MVKLCSKIFENVKTTCSVLQSIYEIVQTIFKDLLSSLFKQPLSNSVQDHSEAIWSNRVFPMLKDSPTVRKVQTFMFRVNQRTRSTKPPGLQNWSKQTYRTT